MLTAARFGDFYKQFYFTFYFFCFNVRKKWLKFQKEKNKDQTLFVYLFILFASHFDIENTKIINFSMFILAISKLIIVLFIP